MRPNPVTPPSDRSLPPASRSDTRQSSAPSTISDPPKPFVATNTDLAIALVTWAIFWLAFFRRFGALDAFVFGFLAGGLAMRFWKPLLILGATMGAVYYAAQK